MRFRRLMFWAIPVLLACLVSALSAKKTQSVPQDDAARAMHALNRLTFGPRPGDLQQVMAMGVDRWIDLQLHPEKINDSALDARLADLQTLRMSSHQIAENFPDQQIIRQVLDGKRSMPGDSARRAIYQVQVARLEQKRERKQETAADANVTNVAASALQNADDANRSAAPAMSNADPNAMSNSTMDDPAARQREDRLYADLAVQQLLDLPPDERYKKILAMSVDDKVAFADSLRGGKGQPFIEGMSAQQKETLLAMNNPGGVVLDELFQSKLLHAVYSERQLQEVMTDFWFNHFNVFANKGADRVLVTSYERDVIRPRALGKFEDLLDATAKSPAMLFYLDNWASVGPNSMQALGVALLPRRGGPWRYPPNAQNRRKRNEGLNENYGRELLELHTLSVNGGYSQRDVTEVAKVFTGWTIERPFDGGEFKFDFRKHEPGPKFVLGHRIKPNGEQEGLQVLHMLATSPQTAHFISLKLAQRFVSDDPPPALVDRMAKTFLKKKGDIREVLSTLFHSPEFWSDAAYRAKVKTPLEFVASAARASGAQIDNAMPLVRQLNLMGMPLYECQPPTGYSMKSETWVTSSDLLNRMNFAVALVAGKFRGIVVSAPDLPGTNANDPTTALAALEQRLFAGNVSKQTNDSILNQMAGNAAQPGNAQARPADVNMIEGLLLGSPEFQRR